MPIFAGVGLANLVVFRRDFVALWHFHQRSTLFIALGMGLFVLGGFGTEVLKYVLLHQQESYIPVLVEKLRVAVEEFSEMLGESLTLYGICLYITQRLEKSSSNAIAKT